MRALVVYESMYGNTRHVAEAIARGMGPTGEVRTVPVSHAPDEDLSGFDLVVVGGPTHVHGMSRESTRHSAVEAAKDPDSALEVEPDAESEGVRDWLASLEPVGGKAAAFDTRIDAPAMLTGRASKGIGRKLRHLGFELVVDPESFLVDKESKLEPGEEDRAEQWGRSVAEQVRTVREQ
ncbi:MAG: flavodoxin domain-containing protein [Rhodococcus sp. (in: high G+C Gram-positive bacteria)]|uniref:flavodoxin family protein n=1 Tax=Rhodococcus sp. TaxID=1831 RepID=UPI003BB179BF